MSCIRRSPPDASARTISIQSRRDDRDIRLGLGPGAAAEQTLGAWNAFPSSRMPGTWPSPSELRDRPCLRTRKVRNPSALASSRSASLSHDAMQKGGEQREFAPQVGVAGKFLNLVQCDFPLPSSGRAGIAVGTKPDDPAGQQLRALVSGTSG